MVEVRGRWLWLLGALVFCHAGSSAAQSLSLRRRLESPSSAPGDRFGAQVALVLGPDRHALVTAPGDGAGIGRAFVFDPRTGVILVPYENPTATAGDGFGATAASIGGNYGGPLTGHIVIGAPFAGSAPGDGLLHVFDTATGNLLRSIADPGNVPGSRFGTPMIAVDPGIGSNPEVLVTSPETGTVYRVDVTSGVVQATYVDPAGGVPGFGTSIAALGNNVLIGSPNDGGGVAHLFDFDGNFIETFHNPGSPGSGFGKAVLAGPFLVAAPDEQGGIVYAFEYGEDQPSQIWANPNPAASGQFGASFTTRKDNPFTVTVGSPQAGTEPGRVYVLDAATGAVVQTIANPDPTTARFGEAIDYIYTSLVVGAPGDGDTIPGAAYLFTTCGDGFVDDGEACDDGNTADGDCCSSQCGFETAGTVCANGACTGPLSLVRSVTPFASIGFFGARVTPFGSDVLVSAPYDSSAGFLTGVVHLYDPTADGFVRTFTSPTPQTYALFGYAVATVGPDVAIGSPVATVAGTAQAGIVHVFDGATGEVLQSFSSPGPGLVQDFGFSLAGVDAELAVGAAIGGELYVLDPATGLPRLTLTDPSGQALPGFGTAVAVEANRVYVSSPGDGAGKVFAFDLATGDTLLTIEPPDIDTTGFGATIGLAAGRLAVAAPVVSGGRVYLFDAATGSYERTLLAPNRCDASEFGTALAASAGGLLVGAPGEPNGSTVHGAAYLYDVASGSLQQAFQNPEPGSPFFGFSATDLGGSTVVGAVGGEHSLGSIHVFTACGDGQTSPGEQCDDGNRTSGDGCSATCQNEGTATTTTSSSTSTSTTVAPSTSTSTSTTTLSGSQPVAVVAPLVRTVQVGDTVTLDGSLSYDPLGSPLGFTWMLSAAPAGSAAVLVDVTTGRPSFVADVAGNYTVDLVVGAHGQTSTTTVAVVTAVTTSALTLNITGPAPEASIDSNETIVRGTVSGAANLGVVVNGIVAAVQGGAFVATGVPLVDGRNCLTATAHSLAGDTLTVSETVNGSGQPPALVLQASEPEGVSPLFVDFSFTLRSPRPITHITMDYDDDGVPDFDIDGDAESAFLQFYYQSPGIYLAHLTVTDDALTTYETRTPIVVQDGSAMDGMLRNVWDGMNQALTNGDIDAALAFVGQASRAKYAPVFAILLPDMSSIVASYSPLWGASISGASAEYVVIRSIDGQYRLFMIYFTRDVDGVWRLDAM